MRVLYGVVGEGMGHATRSRVILEHLLAAGHTVRVVVSGRAHGFLLSRFAGRERITFDEIHGLHMNYDNNAVDKSESLRTNLAAAPGGLLKNIEVYRKIVTKDGFEPEIVVSDFESWAYFYGKNHRIPVLSIDNMQVLNRCAHDDDVTDNRRLDFRLAKTAVKVKLPGCYHYLITSFFFPRVRKKRTTLVPPILRPEILAAKREPGKHILVYQTADNNAAPIPTLKRLPYEFRVYGLGKDGDDGNVKLRAFSETGFVDDLRTARAVIAGGGFSLMGEAVHLHVPMLSVPLVGQFEQELNARYLQKLGYGQYTASLAPEIVEAFLKRIDAHADALEKYRPHTNRMLFDLIDEVCDRVERGDRRPVRLAQPSMGGYSKREDDADDAED
ncbi:MAG: teichoic acid biosynthesis protein [Deltaproteobacteria bacterium]|nr:teichoic acid biosynthesis protein [Deltaproteobacteria bacterium]